VDAGGKAGDLIVYRTTEQKMPILTPNDTTTYIITRAESSETGVDDRDPGRSAPGEGRGPA